MLQQVLLFFNDFEQIPNDTIAALYVNLIIKNQLQSTYPSKIIKYMTNIFNFSMFIPIYY